jgi:hypothetical protein
MTLPSPVATSGSRCSQRKNNPIDGVVALAMALDRDERLQPNPPGSWAGFKDRAGGLCRAARSN